ncbi:hypothetical protein [Actinoalloteichus caeruleus]|uniref:hypothetical protein n=1 Tax=Actinoalloteichus cyanogriseus TaxID=2893586 RepID=UPI000AA97FA1|nr:hypothetical protein [Actinoalloteichus caeruleus]
MLDAPRRGCGTRALLAAVAERRVALDDRARSMLDSASQPHHQLAEVRGGL